MTLRDDLTDALANANVQAFLRVIRAGESSQDDRAYRMMLGGSLFGDTSAHPNVTVRVPGLPASTAAGAYQFLHGTWGECKAALDLPDFSPASQDLAAVYLIRRRGALADVLAGRIEMAITKCNREWASLPGSPYGQPTRTMEQAIATYRGYGGALAAETDAPGSPTAPELEPSAPTPAPEQEQKPMAPLIPVLLQGLAGTLFSIFAPLAREKVEQVLTRKGLPPGVGTQVMTAAVDAARKITGLDDPVQATAAVLAKPELVQAVQADVLDTIDRMMPALSQANRWEQDAWAAEEASRAAAADRMRGDPHAEEIDTFLTRASVRLNAAVMIGVAVLMVVLVVAKADNTIISALGALLVGLATTHKDTLKTRYDHAYGSSRTSAAKDAVIGALSQRGKP